MQTAGSHDVSAIHYRNIKSLLLWQHIETIETLMAPNLDVFHPHSPFYPSM